jgi:hypothetical protein
MKSRAALLVPLAMLLAGAYLVLTALGAEEHLILFGLVDVPRRIGLMLGAITVGGAIVVMIELIGAARRPSGGRNQP